MVMAAASPMRARPRAALARLACCGCRRSYSAVVALPLLALAVAVRRRPARHVDSTERRGGMYVCGRRASDFADLGVIAHMFVLARVGVWSS